MTSVHWGHGSRVSRDSRQTKHGSGPRLGNTSQIPTARWRPRPAIRAPNAVTTPRTNIARPTVIFIAPSGRAVLNHQRPRPNATGNPTMRARFRQPSMATTVAVGLAATRRIDERTRVAIRNSARSAITRTLIDGALRAIPLNSRVHPCNATRATPTAAVAQPKGATGRFEIFGR